MQIDLQKIEFKGEGHSFLKKEIFSTIKENAVIIDGGCKQGWWMQSVNKYIPNYLNLTINRIGVDPISYGETQVNGKYTHYIQAAIGLEDQDEVDFYIVGSEPGCNSLLKPSQMLQNHSYIGKKREITEIKKVPKRRLDSILNDLNISSEIYYVKLDLQGADLDAVKSLGDHLPRVKYIEMEMSLDKDNPFYENSPFIEEIIENLDFFGFEPIQFSSFPLSPLPEGELLFRRK